MVSLNRRGEKPGRLFRRAAKSPDAARFSCVFFEHHSQKTFCESVRFFAYNVPVCRIVIETVTKALKRIKLFFFGIYIKKITKKFHFPKEFLQEYSIG